MYHVECIDIHKDDALYMYLDRACSCANNMRNTANFYIRNLMTGLKKVPSARTENEAFVIETVSGAVPGINRQLLEKRDRKVLRIMGDKSLSEEARAKKAAAVKYLQFTVPTAEKWFASYGLLDAVFKRTDNRDYRAFHAHVMQNAVRDCCEAWLSYFEGLKAYAPGSGHTGKPKIPGYKKSGGRSTAVFSNLACTVRHGTLFFPYGVDGGGKKSRCSVRVSRLPHSSKDKLIEVRAVPYFGSFQLQVVTDDGVPEGSLLPDVKDIINADGSPAGVMTLDPGLECFAAIADNMGNTPIVIKGGALKARNQWFNKRLAALKSEQMRGHDPESFHPVPTRQMQRISRKRAAFLRDTFYKYAHYICRTAEGRRIRYIIMGYNKGQKQGIRIGRRNDQAFVQLPFAKFRRILACTAAKYGIRVIFQEESYTSKACFSARDPIPVFGRENGTPSFSGERVSRGLYRQPDGRVINADINGSLNIGCKYDSRIFPEGKDYSYLYGTVKSMTYSRILGESRRRNDFLMWHTTIKAVPVKRDSGRSVRPVPVKRDSGRSVRPVSAKAARSPRLLAYAKAVG